LVGVAVNVTEVPLHIVVADAATITDGVTSAFTVMIVCTLLAVVGDGQTYELVITTHRLSLLARAALVYVAELVPTGEPFLYHWYTGVAPPLTGMAVKVTDVPAHMVAAEGFPLTDGVRMAFTVITV
jgi:hypothetical protein